MPNRVFSVLLWISAICVIALRGSASSTLSIALLGGSMLLSKLMLHRKDACAEWFFPIGIFIALFGSFLHASFGFAPVVIGVTVALWSVESCSRLRAQPLGAVPFQGLRTLMLAWCLAELCLELVQLFYTNAPFSVTAWRSTVPRLLRQLEIFLSFTLFCAAARAGVWEIVRAELARYRVFIPAILSLIALCFLGQALIVWFGISLPEIFTHTLSSFFRQQGRLSGPFIDPNSAGIALSVVTIMLYVTRRSLGHLGLAVLCLVTLLFTGSRSGLLLLLIASVGYWLSQKCTFEKLGSVRLLLRRVALTVGGVLLLLLLVNVLPAKQLSVLPAGLERTIESVRLDSGAQAFFSRAAMWRVAVAQFKEAPILGVGLDRYRELLPPYAQSIGLALGTWSDNPGNWFLFVAVELGLLGLLFLIADVARLRIDRRRWASVVAVVGSLVFGCHLHDPLSAFVLGILFSSSVEVMGSARQEMRERCALSPLVAWGTIPGIFLVALSFPRGFYGWEMGAHGALVRWSGPESTIVIPCDGGAPIVEFSSIPPSVRKHMVLRVRATIGSQVERAQVVEISASEAASVSMGPTLCEKFSAPFQTELGFDIGYRIVHFSFIPNGWVPKEKGIGADTRMLGAQVRYVQPLPLKAL